MPKIRCQAQDPSTCRYHTATPEQKFWVPKTPRPGTVLNVIETVNKDPKLKVVYPISRTFRIQHQADTETLTRYLKQNDISFTSEPDFNSWQMVFTITARDEEQLKHLAGVEKQKMLSNSLAQYASLRREAQEIAKKNAWRKRLKKPLLEEVEILPLEDWLAVLSEPYKEINSKPVPHIRF